MVGLQGSDRIFVQHSNSDAAFLVCLIYVPPDEIITAQTLVYFW